MTEEQPPPATAAVLVIGDEILSGRTQDTNTRDIARFLSTLGVDLCETRTVRDDQADIVGALNALRSRYDYVFTTGGIGPTHDDITADAVAVAFGVDLIEDAQVLADLEERTGAPLNAARRRMARIPTGGSKIRNPVSGPPGFQIENVLVLAGVPSIMRGMLEDAPHRLRAGALVVSRTLRVSGVGEGAIAAPLEDVAKAHRTLSLGSYPFRTDDAYGAHLVVRGRDGGEVAATIDELHRRLAEIVQATVVEIPT